MHVDDWEMARASDGAWLLYLPAGILPHTEGVLRCGPNHAFLECAGERFELHDFHVSTFLRLARDLPSTGAFVMVAETDALHVVGGFRAPLLFEGRGRDFGGDPQ